MLESPNKNRVYPLFICSCESMERRRTPLKLQTLLARQPICVWILRLDLATLFHVEKRATPFLEYLELPRERGGRAARAVARADHSLCRTLSSLE